MMNREAKVMVAIEKAESEGYVFLCNGTGTQDEALESKRAEGYDVRAWYTKMSGEKSTWEWTMYGRLKGQRRSSQPKNVKSIDEVKAELEAKNVKDLRKMCQSSKIKGYAKMNKQQMIEEIISATAC